MKKILNVFFVFVLFMCFSLKVDALVQPTSKFYVNDYANILSDETENYIINHSSKLAEIDGTQIVVVTVLNLEGYSIESYANNLFNAWGIGEKSKNNGLLLLLALEERMFRVEVGYGLEGILPDSKTGRFQDEYLIPYLKQNKWDEGLKNGYNAFYKEIVIQNNLNLDYTTPTGAPSSSSSNWFTACLIIALILGVLAGLTININPVFLVGIWFALIIGGNLIINLLGNDFFSYFIPSYFAFVFVYLLVYGIKHPSSSGRGGYYSGSSGGHFSGGGHFGGGHSGGGGSSRHF